MAEKKSGFFGRIAKRLSGSLEKNQKSEEAPAAEGNTAIKPPTEEKNVFSERPLIRSETPEKKESFFATASFPSVSESAPALPPKPQPVFKKIVKPAPKPVPKKKRRKRYPDEKRLKKVFRMGQYLSKVRQRRHKLRKTLKAKKAAKTLKIKIRKAKKKTRLTNKAVQMLQQEMRVLSPGIPLPGEEEKEPFAPQFLPGVTIKEGKPVFKQGKKPVFPIEKNETEPVFTEENSLAVSLGKKEAEPETSAPTVPFPEIAPIEKPELKPVPKETAKKQGSIEEEIRAEIKKQRETQEKKPETKKTSVSITEKTRPKPKEEMPPKKETGAAKDEIEELKRLIAEKFEGKVPPQQIQELQEKVAELLKQKAMTKSEMEQNIRMVDANRLLEGFTKLLSLIELNERFEQPPEMPSTIGPQQKPEKYAGTERELEKKELITDFDKILEIVRERGTITLNELASELDLDKRLLKEAIDILEENNLVIQEYPAFGSQRIIDPAYLEKKEKKGEKE